MFNQPSNGTNEQVALKSDHLKVITSDIVDLVDSAYVVYPNQKIQSLSTETVTYCESINIETNEEFFGIIFDRSFQPDIKKIKSLLNAPSCFIKPASFSYTKLSSNNTRHFIAIIPKYNHNDTLTSRFNDIGMQNISYIVNTILPFIIKTIQFCEENGFNAGNINPDNIVYIDNAPCLRECFVAYPHSNQPSHYLASEILDANKESRKLKTSSADVYAAGVTILNTYYGDTLIQSSDEHLKNERLSSGSFSAILGKRRINDEIKAQIKGCLSDSIVERWKIKNLKDWQTGKPTKVRAVLNTAATESFAPVNFNNKNYHKYRALASALFNNWDKGLNFLSEDRVLKWIQRGTGKSKIIDTLDDLASHEYSTKDFTKFFIDKEERLTKALQILDPQGPLRYSTFSAHLSSLSDAFLFAFVNNDKSTIEIIIKFALKKTWEEFKKYEMDFHFDEESIDILIEINFFYNPSILGCGNERVLYYLNPELPCLSPNAHKEYIVNAEDLLIHLDKIAGTSENKNLFDEHIISFLAAKINLRREIYMNLLKNIPLENENIIIHGLIISVLTIRYLNKDIQLANLAAIFADTAIEHITNVIYNVKTRRKIEENINHALDEIDILGILKEISNPQVYNNDQSGYYKAFNDVVNINKRITSLAKNEDVTHFGKLFGQRITVLISYLLFVIILFFTVI